MFLPAVTNEAFSFGVRKTKVISNFIPLDSRRSNNTRGIGYSDRESGRTFR